MTAREHLIAVLAGRASAGLLNSCRLDRGGELYGAEAILASYRAAPGRTDDGDWFEAEGSLAFVGADSAVFADIHSTHIGRIWHIEPVASAVRNEPAIAVAFDVDLAQARGDILLRPEDHPDLHPSAADNLRAAGHAVTSHPASAAAFRARAFAVRAFGDGDQGAALFAVHRLSGDERRKAGFAYASAWWSDNERRTVFARAAVAPAAGDAHDL